MPSRLRILIIDDLEINRRLVASFVTRLGHLALVAADGPQALAICRHEMPDLVLLDIVMPGMDGVEVAGEIRRLAGEHWLPIIFLTARDSELEHIEGLDIGDDCLSKPLSLKHLEARIKVMARIAEMQQHLADDARRLAAYHRETEADQKLTRHLLEHATGYRTNATGPVKRWLKPARHLSGDIVVCARAPGGRLNLLIADCTGHGLAAAISTLPVVDLFANLSATHHGLDTIARALNRRLRRLLPTGRFVAATLLSIDPWHQQIDVWNGGIPAAIFVNNSGQILRRWESRHPPLGILDDAAFEATLERWRWPETGEIVTCTDGLLDATDESGQRFGYDGMLAAVEAAQGKQNFAAVAAAVERHLGGHDSQDDIALLAVNCSAALHCQNCGEIRGDDQLRLPEAGAGSGEWSMQLRFSVADIRGQTLQPALHDWLTRLGFEAVQFDQLLLILTELVNNAVDHGVLCLDSALKQSAEGFADYHRQRAERLAGLESGWIELAIEQRRGEALHLSVRDSGHGFDSATHCAESTASHPYGRGITLVRGLATQLRYADGGRLALVDYCVQKTGTDGSVGRAAALSWRPESGLPAAA